MLLSVLYFSGNLVFLRTHEDSSSVSLVKKYQVMYPGRAGVRSVVYAGNAGSMDDLDEANLWAASSTYDIKVLYDTPAPPASGNLHYFLVDKSNNTEKLIVEAPDYRGLRLFDKNGAPTPIQLQSTFLFDDAAVITTKDTAFNASLYAPINSFDVKALVSASKQSIEKAIYYNYRCEKGKIFDLPPRFANFDTPNVVGRYVIFSDLKSVLVHDVISGEEKVYRLAYQSQLSGVTYQNSKLHYRLYHDFSSVLYTGGWMNLPLYDSNDFSCADLESLKSF